MTKFDCWDEASWKLLDELLGALGVEVVSLRKVGTLRRKDLSSRNGLLDRLVASALTISLGEASSMREARDTEAKPPNTTEWIAPMRAQASIAKMASGTMGM